MKIHHVSVNTAELGAGIYDLIDRAGYAPVVACGMIPLEFMEATRTATREKVIAIAAQAIGEKPEEVKQYIDEAALSEIVRDIEKHVVLAIFDAAKKAGRMYA